MSSIIYRYMDKTAEPMDPTAVGGMPPDEAKREEFRMTAPEPPKTTLISDMYDRWMNMYGDPRQEKAAPLKPDKPLAETKTEYADWKAATPVDRSKDKRGYAFDPADTYWNSLSKGISPDLYRKAMDVTSRFRDKQFTPDDIQWLHSKEAQQALQAMENAEWAAYTDKKKALPWYSTLFNDTAAETAQTDVDLSLRKRQLYPQLKALRMAREYIKGDYDTGTLESLLQWSNKNTNTPEGRAFSTAYAKASGEASKTGTSLGLLGNRDPRYVKLQQELAGIVGPRALYAPAGTTISAITGRLHELPPAAREKAYGILGQMLALENRTDENRVGNSPWRYMGRTALNALPGMALYDGKIADTRGAFLRENPYAANDWSTNMMFGAGAFGGGALGVLAGNPAAGILNGVDLGTQLTEAAHRYAGKPVPGWLETINPTAYTLGQIGNGMTAFSAFGKGLGIGGPKVRKVPFGDNWLIPDGKGYTIIPTAYRTVAEVPSSAARIAATGASAAANAALTLVPTGLEAFARNQSPVVQYMQDSKSTLEKYEQDLNNYLAAKEDRLGRQYLPWEKADLSAAYARKTALGWYERDVKQSGNEQAAYNLGLNTSLIGDAGMVSAVWREKYTGWSAAERQKFLAGAAANTFREVITETLDSNPAIAGMGDDFKTKAYIWMQSGEIPPDAPPGVAQYLKDAYAQSTYSFNQRFRPLISQAAGTAFLTGTYGESFEDNVNGLLQQLKADPVVGPMLSAKDLSQGVTVEGWLDDMDQNQRASVVYNTLDSVPPAEWKNVMSRMAGHLCKSQDANGLETVGKFADKYPEMVQAGAEYVTHAVKTDPKKFGEAAAAAYEIAQKGGIKASEKEKTALVGKVEGAIKEVASLATMDPDKAAEAVQAFAEGLSLETYCKIVGTKELSESMQKLCDIAGVKFTDLLQKGFQKAMLPQFMENPAKAGPMIASAVARRYGYDDLAGYLENPMVFWGGSLVLLGLLTYGVTRLFSGDDDEYDDDGYPRRRPRKDPNVGYDPVFVSRILNADGGAY